MAEYYVLSKGAHDATEKTCNIVLGGLSPISKAPRRTFDKNSRYTAKAVTNITAGTVEAPTTFTATVWLPDPTSVADPKPLAESTRANLVEMTIVNTWNVAETAPIQVRIIFHNGRWELDIVDCPT